MSTLLRALRSVASEATRAAGRLLGSGVPKPRVWQTSIAGSLLLLLLGSGCGVGEAHRSVLTAELPLHLEDHVEEAEIVGADLPEEIPESVEWRDDALFRDWKVSLPLDAHSQPPRLEKSDGGVRVGLGEEHRVARPQGNQIIAAFSVDVPEWNREDWSHLAVRARATGGLDSLSIGFNLQQEPGETAEDQGPFRFIGDDARAISDGEIHTYLFRADWSWGEWEGRLRQIGVQLTASAPASFEVLGITLLSKAARYADARAGVGVDVRGISHRRVLYAHAPGALRYRLEVPEGGRLDFGMGVLRSDVPVTFRVTADESDEALFEEVYSNKQSWAQRSIDLSDLAGQTIDLTLAVEADSSGTVALWAAPTLSGTRPTDRLNVILYVIDGGAADFMSLYGYNRRTTPFLAELAAEGAVFEYAYSNSSWTKTSTPSFMTSLHHSVLGGYRTDSDPIPREARTLAELLHASRYQTATFTKNAYAATLSDLDRGVDVVRDTGQERDIPSSKTLHDDFWHWRQDYPGEPFWVHFQTTDVHWPYVEETLPFAGLFCRTEDRARFHQWEQQLAEAAGFSGPSQFSYAPEIFEKAGVDWTEYYSVRRDLYDEYMAYQDFQIRNLVERLRAEGLWQRTVLIVCADHGSGHGAALLRRATESGSAQKFSYSYRIPLLFVGPGLIEGGRRFPDPVSMIDLMPTVLDLLDIPGPETMQGQSLAPLLLGEPGWKARPVVFDEFYWNAEQTRMEGYIGQLDARWLSLLDIHPEPDSDRPEFRLYDRWTDPIAGGNVAEQHPELSREIQGRLEATWRAHQRLAERYSRSTSQPLEPAQLETLRSLGYIQ